MRGVAISPDGKLIAVEFRRGSTSFIYKIAVDTGIAIRLTDTKAGVESSPAFSADGKRITFTYWPTGASHSEIILANVDGSAMQQWSFLGASAFYPVLSPDNKTIVFGQSGFYGSYSTIAHESQEWLPGRSFYHCAGACVLRVWGITRLRRRAVVFRNDYS